MPRLPPVRVKLVELPLQIGVVPEIEEARVDNVLTITVVLTHVVELQVPFAETKYVVVIVGVITGDDPDIIKLPPQDPVNQFQFAPVPKIPPVMINEEELPIQIGLVPAAEIAGVDKVFTTTVVLPQFE